MKKPNHNEIVTINFFDYLGFGPYETSPNKPFFIIRNHKKLKDLHFFE